MGIIAKQSVRGTIVTYLGVAVGFLTTFFVLTRFLTTEEIGLVRVLTDAAVLFMGLAQLGTNSSIIRFFPYFRDGERNHGFFFWTLVVPLLGFVVFALLYVAFHTPLSAWFGDKSPLFVRYFYLVLPLAFFMLYQAVFETNANVLMSIVVPRAVRELGVRVGLLVLYLLYAQHVLSLNGLVAGLCVNYALAALINLGYLFRLGRISLRPDIAFLHANHRLVRDYLTYTGFLIVSAVAGVLAPTLSSFFITAKIGLNETGIFAIATYIAVMVSIPYRSVTAIASPELSNAIKRDQWTDAGRLVRQVGGNLLLIGGAILLLIWINIDLLFVLLPNGQTYAVARHVVLVLGLSQLILACGSIGLTALNYSRYYAFSLLFSAVLTLSSILLNRWMVPLWGMNGAALSNLLSYALYMTLILLTLRLTCGVRWADRRMLLTALLIALAFAMNTLCCRFLPSSQLWLSSLLRTVLVGGMYGGVACALHLSPEIRQFVHPFYHRHA